MHKQIQEKINNTPFLATEHSVLESVTDYDCFPYPRWYKGVYNSTFPVIDSRNAGWHPRRDIRLNMENTSVIPNLHVSNILFQGACSTVFPKPNYSCEIINHM